MLIDIFILLVHNAKTLNGILMIFQQKIKDKIPLSQDHSEQPHPNSPLQSR
ncbi:hypothetical protein Hanom_Chr13g01209081 [Helianthus anomalus]